MIKRVKETGIRFKTIMPRYLQLEITRNCNLNCLGCYRKSKSSLIHQGDTRNLTPNALHRILAKVPTVRTVSFLGEGEPLMNPYLDTLLDQLGSRGIRSWITTNGTLLTRDIVHRWEGYGISEAHISIDSASKELYESIRVGAKFGDVLHGLELLGRSILPTFINFVGYEENLHELLEVLRLAVGAGCKGINALVPVFDHGSDIEGSFTRPENSEGNRFILSEAYNYAQAKGLIWIGGKPSLEPTFRYCNFPFALPYVTLEGNVYGCCHTPSGERTEWFLGVPCEVSRYPSSKDYLMGNIFKESFKDIWLGRAYNELRSVIKRSEHPRRMAITREELQDIRTSVPNIRFGYCVACLWRWGSAC